MNEQTLNEYLTGIGQCGDRLQFWSRIINDLGLTKIAEVGVWKGDFAAYMLKKCPIIYSYTMIDPWRNLPNWNKPYNVDNTNFEQVFKQAVESTEFASDKVTIRRETTSVAAKSLGDNSLDIAYIDGDHTLRGITMDLMLMFPKICEGGILAGDDFTHSPWQHSRGFEPTLIFPWAVYFAEANRVPIYALGKDQFLIHKDSSKGFDFIDLSNSYHSFDLNSLR